MQKPPLQQKRGINEQLAGLKVDTTAPILYQSHVSPVTQTPCYSLMTSPLKILPKLQLCPGYSNSPMTLSQVSTVANTPVDAKTINVAVSTLLRWHQILQFTNAEVPSPSSKLKEMEDSISALLTCAGEKFTFKESNNTSFPPIRRTSLPHIIINESPRCQPFIPLTPRIARHGSTNDLKNRSPHSRHLLSDVANGDMLQMPSELKDSCRSSRSASRSNARSTRLASIKSSRTLLCTPRNDEYPSEEESLQLVQPLQLSTSPLRVENERPQSFSVSPSNKNSTDNVSLVQNPPDFKVSPRKPARRSSLGLIVTSPSDTCTDDCTPNKRRGISRRKIVCSGSTGEHCSPPGLIPTPQVYLKSNRASTQLPERSLGTQERVYESSSTPTTRRNSEMFPQNSKAVESESDDKEFSEMEFQEELEIKHLTQSFPVTKLSLEGIHKARRADSTKYYSHNFKSLEEKDEFVNTLALLQRLSEERDPDKSSSRINSPDALEMRRSQVPSDRHDITVFKGLWHSHSAGNWKSREQLIVSSPGRPEPNSLSKEHRRSRTAWNVLDLDTTTQLLAENQKRYNEAHLLMTELTKLCGSSLKDAADCIVKTTCKTLDCPRACLYLVNRDGTELCPISNKVQSDVSSNIFLDYLETTIPVGPDSVAGSCALKKAFLKVDDVELHPQFIRDLHTEPVGFNGVSVRKSRSILCVPLLDSNGEPAAVLKAVNKRPSLLERNQSITPSRSPVPPGGNRGHDQGTRSKSPTRCSIPSSVPFGDDDAPACRLLMDAVSFTLVTCGMMSEIQEQRMMQEMVISALNRISSASTEHRAAERAAKALTKLIPGCSVARAYLASSSNSGSVVVDTQAAFSLRRFSTDMDSSRANSRAPSPSKGAYQYLTMVYSTKAAEKKGSLPSPAATRCAVSSEAVIERGDAQLNTVGTLCVPACPAEPSHPDAVAVLELVGPMDGSDFSTEDQKMAASVASLLGAVILSLQEKMRMVALAKRLAVRAMVVEQLTTKAPVPTVMQTLAEAGKQLLGVQHFRIWLLDNGQDQLWTPLVGAGCADCEIERMPNSQGLIGRAFTRNEAVLENDAQSAEGYNPTYDAFVTRSGAKHAVLAIPIIDTRGPLADSGQNSSTNGPDTKHVLNRRNSTVAPLVLGVIEAINKLPSETSQMLTPKTVTTQNNSEAKVMARVFNQSIQDKPNNSPQRPPNRLSIQALSTQHVPEKEGTAQENGLNILPFTDTDVDELQNFISEFLPALRQLMPDAGLFKSRADETEILLSARVEVGVGGYSVGSLMSIYSHRSERQASTPSASRKHFASSPQRRRLKNMMTQYLARSMTSLQEDLRLWDLDVLSMTNNEIFERIIRTLRYLDLIDNKKIDNFAGMLEQISECYNQNPYHNFNHGFHVFHTTFCMLCSKDIVIPETYVCLAILLAALCHDIDHPGYNNTLVVHANHVNTKAMDVALRKGFANRYGDEAVLERHHISVTFKIISDPKYSIFSDISLEKFKRARKIMSHCILSTDMARHAEIVKAVASLDSPFTSEVILNPIASYEFSLIDAVVHSADMCAQTVPIDQALRWGDRCLKEFQNQAILEEKLGLPLSPFMQGLDSKQQQGRLQADFVTYVLKPLWTQMSRLLPDVLEHVMERLEKTRETYEQWASLPKMDDSKEIKADKEI